jgi:hypothetical protein
VCVGFLPQTKFVQFQMHAKLLSIDLRFKVKDMTITWISFVQSLWCYWNDTFHILKFHFTPIFKQRFEWACHREMCWSSPPVCLLLRVSGKFIKIFRKLSCYCIPGLFRNTVVSSLHILNNSSIHLSARSHHTFGGARDNLDVTELTSSCSIQGQHMELTPWLSGCSWKGGFMGLLEERVLS